MSHTRKGGINRLWPRLLLILMLGPVVSVPVNGLCAAPLSDGESDEACSAIRPQIMLQTVSGSLSSTTQFREWCFDAAADQSFEFSTCPPEGSATFLTGIEIWNSDATRSLEGAYSSPRCDGRTRLVWTAPAAGSYRVRVRGGLASGTFTLGYRVIEPPPCALNLTPATGFQIVSGSIGSGQFRDYCFNASAGRIYDFTTCAPGSAEFASVIEIRDRLARTLLAIDDNFCNTRSYVSWRATRAGPLRARVYALGAESGAFDLAYRVSPLPPCDPVMPELEFQTTEGVVEPDDFQDFCFDASAGETYEFQTCAPGAADFAAVLEIQNETGDTSLARSGAACGLQARVVWTAPSAVRVRVRVRGASGREFGYFSLAHRRRLCIPITPGTGYQTARGSIARGEFVDYCFQGTPGQRYSFMTCLPGSATFASTLEIRTSPEAAEVFTSPVACSGQSLLVWSPFARGDYRVRVRGVQPRDSGDFELAYRLGAPESEACAPIKSSMHFRNASGTLRANGRKAYCFNAEANDLFEFTTCPPEGRVEFTPTMALWDVDGTTPLPVDRPSCSFGQRLLFRAPARGRYRVTIYNSSPSSGAFTMAHRLLSPVPCTVLTPTDAYQSESETLTSSVARDYCFDARADKAYIFTTCSPWGDTSFPIGLEIRNAFDTYTAPEMDRQSCGSGQSVLFRAPAADRYRVRVRGGSEGDTYTLAYRIWAPWLQRSDAPRPGGVRDASVVAVDDRVYLFGGYPGLSNQLWAYDPRMDTWTRRATLPATITNAAVVALDGRIYVFGGAHSLGRGLDTTWIYDTVTDIWSEGHRLPSGRWGAAAAVVGDKILIAGGYDIEPLRTTLLYDPETDTFAPRAALPAPLYSVRGATLIGRTGRVEVHLFTGSSAANSHMVYDVLSDTWRSGGSTPVEAQGPAVITLDNRVYVVGGSPITRTQIYDPATDAWSQGPPLFTPIINTSGAAVDGVIYLIGGARSTEGPYLNSNYAWLVESAER